MELTKRTLCQCINRTVTSQLKKYYYEDFHVSPLMVSKLIILYNIFFKIHLSFSQGGSLNNKNKKHKTTQDGICLEFLNTILKSVGITLTEIQDIVFK